MFKLIIWILVIFVVLNYLNNLNNKINNNKSVKIFRNIIFLIPRLILFIIYLIKQLIFFIGRMLKAGLTYIYNNRHEISDVYREKVGEYEVKRNKTISDVKRYEELFSTYDRDRLIQFIQDENNDYLKRGAARNVLRRL